MLKTGPWTLKSKYVCNIIIHANEYLYLPETSVDGFAKLTKYNQTKLLAKMALQRYYNLKTCNGEFTHIKYKKTTHLRKFIQFL